MLYQRLATSIHGMVQGHHSQKFALQTVMLADPSLYLHVSHGIQVEYVYAKQYQLRERGLHQVHDILSTSEVHSRKELSTMVKATVQILKKGLNDKVLSVSGMEKLTYFCLSLVYSLSPSLPLLASPQTFSGSLDLLKYLVGPYAQQHKLVSLPVTACHKIPFVYSV